MQRTIRFHEHSSITFWGFARKIYSFLPDNSNGWKNGVSMQGTGTGAVRCRTSGRGAGGGDGGGSGWAGGRGIDREGGEL